MATTQQDKASKAGKGEKPLNGSIGFLRAAEKAHISVGDIPLTFFEDLGYAPSKMQSAKDLNRRFVGGMYSRLDSFTEQFGEVAGAPARLAGRLVDKLQAATESEQAEKAVKAKPAAKKSIEKKSRAKAKAAAPKAKSKAAKAKDAKPKAKSKATSAKAKAAAPKAKRKAAISKAKAEIKAAASELKAEAPKAKSKPITAAKPVRKVEMVGSRVN